MPTAKKKSLKKPAKLTLPELKKQLSKHTDAICKELLNDDYKKICRVMIKCLCVEDSPALEGDLRTWAAAVVGAIGYVNDLHDSKLEPHYSKAAFLKKLNVDEEVYQACLKVLINGFDLILYDPDFTLPSLIPMNSLIAMTSSPTLLQESGCCGGGCSTSACGNPADCSREGCEAAGSCLMQPLPSVKKRK